MTRGETGRAARATLNVGICLMAVLLVLSSGPVRAEGTTDGPTAGSASPAPTPERPEANWCANVPEEDGCVQALANGTANWTVLLNWTAPANGTPAAEVYVIANQSTATPFFSTAANLSRAVRFPANATDSVVLGTNLKLGWGLNPTQNWLFGLCAVAQGQSGCLSISAFTVTVRLEALFPSGTINGPSNITLAWTPRCTTTCSGDYLTVSWAYENGLLTANFFRVGLLNGSVCLQPPTLAEWNRTTWRENTTTGRSYRFGGLDVKALENKDLCAYVEAVNSSIGNGITTIYSHGLPAKEGLLTPGPLCPRCTKTLPRT